MWVKVSLFFLDLGFSSNTFITWFPKQNSTSHCVKKPQFKKNFKEKIIDISYICDQRKL